MKKPVSSPAAPSEEALHAQGLEHVEALEGMLKGARSMMTEHRRRSAGRLVYRDAKLYGELLGVIEGSRVRAAFDALGAQDQGTDPRRFETELLRSKLARVERLSGVSQRLRALADRLDDEAMLSGGPAVADGAGDGARWPRTTRTSGPRRSPRCSMR